MVPNGWKLCSLVDVTSWSSGGTPSKSNPDYWGGDVPWISAASMRGHYYSNSDLKITELAVNEKAKMAKKGTILLLVRGSMLWNKIPVGITSRRVAFNQDVKCISPKPKELDVTFLLYWFLAKENKLMGMVTGTGIGAGKLDTNDLQSLDVFLPPLPEQRKIATTLGTWDKAISTTERLIDNSKQQKKALMQQLLTGKKRFAGFSKDWKQIHLGDIGKCITGLTYKPTDTVDDGVLVLRSSNIQNSKLTFKDNVFVSADLKIKSKTQENDILVCVRNGSKNLIGKSTLIKGRAVGQAHGAFMTLFRGKHPLYVSQLFQSSEFFRQVNMNLGATINSINTSDLHKFKFTIPTDEVEINAIASCLSNADKEIELLEQQLADLKHEKKALMQQLLTGKRRVKVDNSEVV